MQIVTSETIEGKSFETLNYVSGSVVQSKHFGRDFMAGLKSVVGGELKGYTEMITEARTIAIGRMCDEAAALGADAVVTFRLSTSAVAPGAAEIMAYGTAVKFR